MSFSQYSGHIPRCQHIKTNGTQCGSPALHRKRFCYFHNRWRATSINLKRVSASHSASLLELPVLEDADSIQVALMQVMRLILRRQLDHKTAGLLLYGLQTASANLRRIDFEHRHKPDVIIDPRTVGENGVGQEAWYPEDFEEEEEASADGGVQPKPAREAAPSVARTCPERQPKEPSPATGAAPDVARKPSSTPMSGPNRRHKSNELQRMQAALHGAEQGNLRDLKTVFEFAGIRQPNAEVPSAGECEST